MKAFFSKHLGDFVVDEMCRCGHFKSKHGSLCSKVQGSLIRHSGEGNCCSGSCECLQFTFVRFVTVTEAALKIKKRRAVA